MPGPSWDPASAIPEGDLQSPAPAASGYPGDTVAGSAAAEPGLAGRDPRSSLELAAGLVDDSVESVVMSVREQQHSLLSARQGDDAGTGELRTALRQYRPFRDRLEDFSRET